MADLYAVLGVEPSASAADIKRAFRKQAAVHHPDRGGDENEFKKLAHAYEVLGDADRRARYDRFGDEGTNGQSSTGDPLSDMFSMFFGEAFGFGGGRGGGRQRDASHGRDVLVRAEVTLEEVAVGTRLDVTVELPMVCDSCQGSGSNDPSSRPQACQTCDGAGQVLQVTRTMFANVQTQTTCPTCRGGGTVVTDPCGACSGAGRKKGARTIAVDVPAGVHDGQRIRIAGAGEAGRTGSAGGDLIVEVSVVDHEVFVRDGNHLWAALRLPMERAALGGSIKVSTLTGDEVAVEIPRGVQHDAVIRVPDAGLVDPSGHGRGELRLRVVVLTAGELTDEEAALLEEFAALREQREPDRSSWFGRIRDVIS